MWAYRGTFGDPRPARLERLALPPHPMPSRDGLRPLKAWRYVGAFGEDFMLCACRLRIGPARQGFWALWDRRTKTLHQGDQLNQVTLATGWAGVEAPGLRVELELEEQAGIETVAASGISHAWTRKQGGIGARGVVTIDGLRTPMVARAIVDDTAAYYERHTVWRWSAGVGVTEDGASAAWNLVEGVNDPEHASERTVWIDGAPHEVPPSVFAPDLSGVDGLAFAAEATREQVQNRLIVRSRYRQPFGTFTGTLPGGERLQSGLGVMEAHDVFW